MVATANGHAVLDRRLALAESLSCRASFADLEALDADLNAAVLGRPDLSFAVDRARAQLEDAETIAALAVEGKNEAERKGKLRLALRDDAGYQGCAAAVRAAEATLAGHDAAIDALKRRVRRIERFIEYRVAVLRFLAE